MKDSGIRIRVEEELRMEFLEACRREDQTAAQVIRGFMRTYAEERCPKAQSELFCAPKAKTIRNHDPSSSKEQLSKRVLGSA